MNNLNLNIKPKGTYTIIYNLISVFKYLDTIRSGFYDRMRDFLYYEVNAFSNDMYYYLDFSYILRQPMLYRFNEDIIKDVQLLLEEYPDTNEALWFVSW